MGAWTYGSYHAARSRGLSLSLVVVQAIPKGGRGELAVELMTEVGVDVIVPWAAARCIPLWQGGRAAKGGRPLA